METFRRLIEAIEAEGAAALVTLAETAGSAHAKRARAWSCAPSGGFYGTIGGGELECEALDEARAALAAGRGAARRRSSRSGRSSASAAAGASSGASRPSTARSRGARAAQRRRARRPVRRAGAPRRRRPRRAPPRRGGRGRRLARSVRRGGDAGLSVRRRPCRPRAGAGAGAAALRGALDRPARRRVSPARARQRHDGRRRRSARRTGGGARRRARAWR